MMGTAEGCVNLGKVSGLGGSLIGVLYEKGRAERCLDVSRGPVFGEIGPEATADRVFYALGGVESREKPETDYQGVDGVFLPLMGNDGFTDRLGRYDADGGGTRDGYFETVPGNYPLFHGLTTEARIAAEPAAKVTVRDPFGNEIRPVGEGTYRLCKGVLYTCRGEREGYRPAEKTFRGGEESEVSLRLGKEAPRKRPGLRGRDCVTAVGRKPFRIRVRTRGNGALTYASSNPSALPAREGFG